MPRRKKPPPPRGPLLEIARELGVALVNTAGANKNNRQQGVASYADFLTWSQQVGTLSVAEAERLGRRAAERPSEAEWVFGRMATLRSALFRIFLALQTGEEPSAEDLDTVSAAIAETMPALRLVRGADGFRWGWAGDQYALDRPLWPVLYSAAEVLIAAGGELDVRQCAHTGCTLFFVDRTPTRQRMYCSKTCDNRAQSLRYYYRHVREKRAKRKRERGIWRARRPRKTNPP